MKIKKEIIIIKIGNSINLDNNKYSNKNNGKDYCKQ